MSTTVQISIAFLTAIITVWVLKLVGQRQLRSKYALLWVVLTLPLVPLSLVPAVVNRTADELGVGYQPALVFSLALLLMLGILIYFSWELSRLEARTRVLGEEIAMLNERLTKLEERNVDDRP